uniref:Uncharacterized protein n=1 Tax=Arundo donax TaxID=35708 RepID=A0A0A9HE73_ARUDO
MLPRTHLSVPIFIKDDVGYLRVSFGVQRCRPVGRRLSWEGGGLMDPILGA